MKTTQIGLDLAKSVVEVCHKFLQDVRARQQQTLVSAQPASRSDSPPNPDAVLGNNPEGARDRLLLEEPDQSHDKAKDRVDVLVTGSQNYDAVIVPGRIAPNVSEAPIKRYERPFLFLADGREAWVPRPTELLLEGGSHVVSGIPEPGRCRLRQILVGLEPHRHVEAYLPSWSGWQSQILLAR